MLMLSRLIASLSGLLLTAPLALTCSGDFTVDLGRGPVTVHVPDIYQAGTAAPLIVLLHGYSGSGAWQEFYMGFRPYQEEYGFIFTYPDGLTNSAGYRYWNGTDACCDFDNSGVDDAAYLEELVNAIRQQVDIDPRRIHFVGHSNGGFMAYRMACEHADWVASVAGLAGATFKNRVMCAPSEPVHVLQIHGTNDSTIGYNGGWISGVPYPGALESVLKWAAYDGCDPVPDNSSPNINLDTSVPGKETVVSRYESSCWPTGAAELWAIQGGGHVPSLTNQFPTKVIKWLYRHPKAGVTATRYCSPAATNSSGQSGWLDASGSDAIQHNNFSLTASNLPINQFGYFMCSLDPGFVANPGGSAGNLCLGGTALRLTSLLGGTGTGGTITGKLKLNSLPGPPPNAVVTGDTWYFQTWFRDKTTSNFTDALSVLFR
jgi:polyhydroxybutyrate depolymerase